MSSSRRTTAGPLEIYSRDCAAALKGFAEDGFSSAWEDLKLGRITDVQVRGTDARVLVDRDPRDGKLQDFRLTRGGR